jgi:glycosyltransferase involved in cell wall biosynthesis
MKILMLAPEPFFEPRGTPISIYFRIRALGQLGHSVSLVTYPLGRDMPMTNLKIIRAPNPLMIRGVKIGPSLAKLPLDLMLLFRAAFELATERYDLIFSHEEAGFLAGCLAKIWPLPHIYDMHSSLPQQLRNFEFSRSRVLISLFEKIERFVLKNAQAVIVICRDLRDKVDSLGFGPKAVLLENFLDFPSEDFTPQDVKKIRTELAPGGERIVLYAGNFEPYQGIPLLLEAALKVETRVVFVLVGGTGPALAEMKKTAANLGISSRTVFVEKVPPSRVPLYVSAADVLVSPRLSGTNTPLKIYSFLKSGRPLVATNLWTHTQVLGSGQAILVDPDPRSLAEGIRFALFHPEAKTRAQAAKERAEGEYTEQRYLEKMARILNLARRNHRR